MNLSVVFEIPISKLAEATKRLPESGKAIIGNPIDDALNALAHECAEVFYCSWDGDGNVTEEHYFDHEFSPGNAFVGLRIDDSSRTIPSGYFKGAWRKRADVPIEIMLMEKAVESVAKRFGAQVIIIGHAVEKRIGVRRGKGGVSNG